MDYGYFILFYFILFYLTTPSSLWDLSSPTRGQTQALDHENVEFYPLDQGIP